MLNPISQLRRGIPIVASCCIVALAIVPASVAAMSLSRRAPRSHVAAQARPMTITNPYALDSGVLPLITSTGVHIGVSFFVEGGVTAHHFGGPIDIGFDLVYGNLSYNPPYEDHGWSFTLPSGTSFGSATKGVFMADTGATMHPYGMLKLSFTQVTRKPDRCTSGSGAILTGTLSALFTLHTLSKNWGDVNSKGRFMSLPGPNQLALYGNCASKRETPTCDSTVSWSSPEIPFMKGNTEIGNEELAGYAAVNSQGTKIGTIEAGRDYYLTKPKGQRSDRLFDVTARQAYNSTTKVLQVRAYRGKAILFTGSATLTGETASTATPETCRLSTGKGTATETYTSYLANFTNGSGAPLTAHMSWGGNITIPNEDAGRISIDAY